MNDAQPIIGDLKMSEVNPLHYQSIFKRMEANYAGSTIRRTYVSNTWSNIQVGYRERYNGEASA